MEGGPIGAMVSRMESEVDSTIIGVVGVVADIGISLISMII